MTLQRLAPDKYNQPDQTRHDILKEVENKNVRRIFEHNGIYSDLPLSAQDGDQRRSLEIKDFSKLEKGLLKLDKPNQKSTSKNQS